MAFNRESARTPTSIGVLYVRLALPVSGSATATFEVEVRDANGIVMRCPSGDLLPHLTAQQINTINTFLTNLKTQAENQIL